MFKKMAQNIAKSTSEVIGYGVLVTDEKGLLSDATRKKGLENFTSLR